jgi:hypothetical protein
MNAYTNPARAQVIFNRRSFSLSYPDVRAINRRSPLEQIVHRIPMASLLYRIFVLFVLFLGGYLLMRFGMAIDHKTSLIFAVVVMPLATLIVWLRSYRGKKFK